MYCYTDYYQYYGKTTSTTSTALMFLCLEWNSGAVHLNVTSKPRAVRPAHYSQSEHTGGVSLMRPVQSVKVSLTRLAAARVPVRVHCCSPGTQRKCLQNKCLTTQRRQPKRNEVTFVLWSSLKPV